VSPPDANADFVYHMEDVLDVYTRPADPARPVVCLDETSRQLLGEVAPPQPVTPGAPARQDYDTVIASCGSCGSPGTLVVHDARTPRRRPHEHHTHCNDLWGN